MSAVETISAQALHQLQGQSPFIVDVRTHAEIDSLYYPGCERLPLQEMNQQSAEQLEHKGQPIYLLCALDKRAYMAAKLLRQWLSNELIVVTGGLQAMAKAQVPLVKGERDTLSLERQVRICAGALVLSGVLLGTWVHAGFFGLSGFVGAGLMFAGITDTCAMGMLLAAMPWNKQAKT